MATCDFCGSRRQVKRYFSAWNAGPPDSGDIHTAIVHACQSCSDPNYGGSEAAFAPKIALL